MPGKESPEGKRTANMGGGTAADSNGSGGSFGKQDSKPGASEVRGNVCPVSLAQST